MDSYSGGRRGGKARGRAAAPPHHCEEVRGERKKARLGGPCGAGASVGQKEKRPGFLQGAVSLFCRYFIALARLSVTFSRAAGAR